MRSNRQKRPIPEDEENSTQRTETDLSPASKHLLQIKALHHFTPLIALSSHSIHGQSSDKSRSLRKATSRVSTLHRRGILTILIEVLLGILLVGTTGVTLGKRTDEVAILLRMVFEAPSTVIVVLRCAAVVILLCSMRFGNLVYGVDGSATVDCGFDETHC
jgi:hypothetical protein